MSTMADVELLRVSPGVWMAYTENREARDILRKLELELGTYHQPNGPNGFHAILEGDTLKKARKLFKEAKLSVDVEQLRPSTSTESPENSPEGGEMPPGGENPATGNVE